MGPPGPSSTSTWLRSRPALFESELFGATAALEQLDLPADRDRVGVLAADLDGLTIGDVAAMLRRCRTLLDVSCAAELGEALRGEIECRGPRTRRIGY